MPPSWTVPRTTMRGPEAGEGASDTSARVKRAKILIALLCTGSLQASCPSPPQLPPAQDPHPCPSPAPSAPPSPGEGYPWGVFALLPLLPVGGRAMGEEGWGDEGSCWSPSSPGVGGAEGAGEEGRGDEGLGWGRRLGVL